MEHLSTGILNRIINGETINDPFILQFVGSRFINNNDKYRLWLSDGEIMTSYAFGHSKDMELLQNGILTVHSLCKVTNHVLTKTRSLTPVIMIKSIEVVISGNEVGIVLGNPVTYEPKAVNINEQVPEEVRVNPPPQISHNDTTNNRLNSQQQIFTVPIMDLSPYYGKWTIRARVSAKTDIRHWNNPRGQGQLFSMDLIDESGEIRCTGFNDQVAALYDAFEVGCIYYINRCQVKPANKKFTTIKHEFELTLTAETGVLRYEGNDPLIPMRQFDFSVISDIEFKEGDSVTDVLAIIKSVGEAVRFKSKKNGEDLVKRDILLVDDSNVMVTLTLWGNQAEEFSGTEGSGLAIKGVSVKEFNGGKSLSSLSGTIIQVNPAIPQIENIQAWFNETERAKNAKMLSNVSPFSSINLSWLNFQQVQEQNIGAPGTVGTFLTKATIGSMKHQNALYKACPMEGCRKKLLDPINGMYRCSKCNADFPNFVYRMIVQATLLDHTQELRVTIFQDEAESILNKSSQELGEIYENLSTDIYEDVFEDCKFKSFIFKILMKQDFFNNVTRIKAVVLGVSPVNAAEYSSHLLKEIKNIIKSPPTCGS